MTVEPGQVFAEYTIRRRIGAGGMGTVFLARHPRLPIDIALKILAPELGRDSSARARFQREAEIASRLRHPHIVRVYDRGVEGEQLWISMDYIDGPDATHLLQRGPLEPRTAVDIVEQAARALDHAHRHGVLHRDIKPANLLVADDDGRNHIFLTDFGIARGLDDTMTVSDSIRATFAYAAPEMLSGGALDHRVDVYALGATLHHLLTGTVPFPRATLAAVLHAHLADPPPRPTAQRPELPAAFDQVIATALAKDPADRYPTCAALAESALAALQRPAPIPPRPLATTLRNPAFETQAGTETQRATPHPVTPPHAMPQHITDQRPPRADPFSRPADPHSMPADPRSSHADPAPSGAVMWGAPPVTPPRSAPRGRPRRSVLVAAALAVLLGAGLLLGYNMIRDNYYVGADNDRVVLMRGLPGSALGISIHDVHLVGCISSADELRLVDPTEVRQADCAELELSDIKATGRAAVSQGLPSGSLDEAIQQMENLVQRELLPRCEGSGTPSSTGTPAPTTTNPVTATAPPLGPHPAGQDCRATN